MRSASLLSERGSGVKSQYDMLTSSGDSIATMSALADPAIRLQAMSDVFLSGGSPRKRIRRPLGRT